MKLVIEIMEDGEELDHHLKVLETLVEQEDYENAAWQRDFLFEGFFCRKRVQIGEARALESLKKEAREFRKSKMLPDEWQIVRRKKLMEAGIIPYELLRYRSPFK